jgi:hypothetical protein
MNSLYLLNALVAKALNHKTEYDVKKVNKKQWQNVKSNYSDAIDKIKQGLVFYRADREKSKPIIEVYPGIRVSEDSNNVYTLLFSYILPSWKNFPKRTESIIFSSSKEGINKYLRNNNKSAYIVLPRNSAKIAICPTEDMWDAFSNSFLFGKTDDLHIFDDSMIDAMTAVLDFKNKIDNEKQIQKNENCNDPKISTEITDAFKSNDYIKVKEYLDTFNYVINNYDKDAVLLDNYYLYSMSKNIIKNSNNIISTLDDACNPKLNNFNLVNIKNISTDEIGINSPNGISEMWTDSPCLFVKSDYIDDFLN